jgi:hypothetical protein
MDKVTLFNHIKNRNREFIRIRWVFVDVKLGLLLPLASSQTPPKSTERVTVLVITTSGSCYNHRPGFLSPNCISMVTSTRQIQHLEGLMATTEHIEWKPGPVRPDPCRMHPKILARRVVRVQSKSGLGDSAGCGFLHQSAETPNTAISRITDHTCNFSRGILGSLELHDSRLNVHISSNKFEPIFAP